MKRLSKYFLSRQIIYKFNFVLATNFSLVIYVVVNPNHVNRSSASTNLLRLFHKYDK